MQTLLREVSTKNLHDQIIEGLRDAEIIQDLLKENNLTPDNTIARCSVGDEKQQGNTAQIYLTKSRRKGSPVDNTVGESKCISWARNLFRLWRSMAQRDHQQCTAYGRTCT